MVSVRLQPYATHRVRLKPSRSIRVAVRARVVAWQRTHGRHDLPWQNTRDPYRIWLSEIMLQQTQVAAVLPYYRASSPRFPTSPRLAARADRRRARALERPRLLPARASPARGRAQAIVASTAARFRVTPRRWPRCPASAARRRRRSPRSRSARASAILDGNVKRVLARHRGDRRMARRAEGRSRVVARRRSAAARRATSRRTRRA